MTQAFNLSQLANNVNTSGLLNAAAGLYNQTPVANGGTGRSSVTSGNLLLGAGTSAMTELTGGTVGNVLSWNGSAWVSGAASGGALQTYDVATTPGTWTKPATLKGVRVTVVGGGGGGGTVGPSAIAGGGGGGGGGGAAIRLYPAPSIPGPQPYTVGGAGATTSFGSTVTVISATGGATGGSTTSTGVSGGAGGIGSSGLANMAGGGGSSGSPQNGGSGGSSIFGGGANGVWWPGGVGSAPGQAGRAYGGGGSGGGKSTPNTTAPGGAGAAGVVIIEEFY